MAGAIFVNKAVQGITVLLPNTDSATIQASIAGTSSDLFKTLPADQLDSVLDVIVKSIDDVYVFLFFSPHPKHRGDILYGIFWLMTVEIQIYSSHCRRGNGCSRVGVA
jgi:hypothetical protein